MAVRHGHSLCVAVHGERNGVDVGFNMAVESHRQCAIGEERQSANLQQAVLNASEKSWMEKVRG